MADSKKKSDTGLKSAPDAIKSKNVDSLLQDIDPGYERPEEKPGTMASIRDAVSSKLTGVARHGVAKFDAANDTADKVGSALGDAVGGARDRAVDVASAVGGVRKPPIQVPGSAPDVLSEGWNKHPAEPGVIVDPEGKAWREIDTTTPTVKVGGRTYRAVDPEI